MTWTWRLTFEPISDLKQTAKVQTWKEPWNKAAQTLSSQSDGAGEDMQGLMDQSAERQEWEARRNLAKSTWSFKGGFYKDAIVKR